MAKRKGTLKRKMVEACLRDMPETRNSDITLMIAIWKRYYPHKIKKGSTGEEGIWLKDLYDLPREDGVKRIRADFNHNGQYYPTDWAVAKGRQIAEDKWREEMGYPPVDETANPTKAPSYTQQFSGKEKPSTLFDKK